ncbi:MAG: ADP-forming succinate--CoA ligase subunit beta [Rhodospirillaceae bacterium]|nr:ADP-forming succinate--CoA ligase subunit beta [Rhodospirillaceae bacterium]
MVARRDGFMNLHEYQAKQVLAGFGVPVPSGVPVLAPEEAAAAVDELGGPVWVVKAQIHAGGRGKAGGVKVCTGRDEAVAAAQAMFGKVLVTHQTGPAGREVRRVYLEDGADIAHEYYLGAVVDRESGCVALIASREGGVEIEAVAAENPQAIVTVPIDPASGFQPHHGRRIAFGLGLSGETAKAAGKLARAVHDAVLGTDASLVEINPLIETRAGSLIALDAKVSIDDNALYRRREIAALRDADEEDPAERAAGEHELSYVKLDGNIGCMVNGAGLAMATMDIIKLHGAEPANFLDVGGGATRERVTEAFKIILSDPNVRGILVNIFGGIMRCDVIAEGIVAAAREVSLELPLVVRLEGTNVEKGKEILDGAGIDLIAAGDLGDAAAKVVQAIERAG